MSGEISVDEAYAKVSSIINALGCQDAISCSQRAADCPEAFFGTWKLSASESDELTNVLMVLGMSKWKASIVKGVHPTTEFSKMGEKMAFANKMSLGATFKKAEVYLKPTCIPNVKEDGDVFDLFSCCMDGVIFQERKNPTVGRMLEVRVLFNSADIPALKTAMKGGNTENGMPQKVISTYDEKRTVPNAQTQLFIFAVEKPDGSVVAAKRWLKK